MRRAAVVFTALTFLWSLTQAPGFIPALAQQGEDAVLLRELAERILESPYGYSAPTRAPGARDEPSVLLLVGQLPTDPALDVPVPPGGRLIGSYVRRGSAPSSSTGPDQVQIVVDAPGTPAASVAFYEQALPQRGWTSGNYRMGSSGGFVQQSFASTSYFCQGDSTLTVQAWQRAGRQGMTEVRVGYMGSSPPCVTPTMPEGYTSPYDRSGMMGLYQSLPSLYPPDGVTIRQSGGYGGSAGSTGMEARATTSMGAAELEAFFARQLTEKGWARRSGQVSGPIAWSAWAVPDLEGFQGFVSVRELPGTDQRILGIRIDSESEDPGGYYSSGPYYYGSPSYTATPATPLHPASAAPMEGRE